MNASKSPRFGRRILAGRLRIESESVFFEVWAYRKFSNNEMDFPMAKVLPTP
jgi:hypothetical protein